MQLYFLPGYCSSSMSETMWNSCKFSLLTWNGLTGGGSMEVPIRKMNASIWEKILLMQLPLCYPQCKSENCGMKGRTYWQGIAGDTRMAMQLKKDHGLEQLWGKETLHYLRWVSGRSKAYCIMPLCIFCPRNSFMSVHSRWHFN